MALLIGVCAERSDVAAYVRGKLLMGGVTHSTPIADALDVIQVAIMDVPVEELEKWRRQFNHQVWKIRPPSREEWGRLPGQAAQMGRLAGQPPTLGSRAAPDREGRSPSRGSRGHRP